MGQLLADEQLTTTGASVLWALGDNQNTVRDLVSYSSGTSSVVDHVLYSAFGQVLSQTNESSSPASVATVDCLFGYTGRPLDTATNLQNNLNRWYNADSGSVAEPGSDRLWRFGCEPLSVLRERAGERGGSLWHANNPTGRPTTELVELRPGSLRWVRYGDLV